jgi:ribulose 1,5-bisphosphate synthetase/thiazole synthase
MSNISVAQWHLDGGIVDRSRLPELASVDVLVIGAGAAGVAAATVAAEGGASVIIIEKYGFAGGAAVAGLSGTVCGLYLAREGGLPPEQVVSGFTQRFIEELERKGGITAPQRYGKTYTRAHDPLKWREVADGLFDSAGVRVIYHTTLIDVLVVDGSFGGAVVASNAGISMITARRVIDASGDAAAIARGTGRFHFGHDGRIQNPTMFFRLGNVDTERFWNAWGGDTISPAWVSEALVDSRAAGADLPRDKIWVFATGRPGELLVNATRLMGPGGRMLNVIDPADFTMAETGGRRQIRAYADFLSERVAGCERSYVVDTGVEAGIRQTRTIEGVATLTNEQVVKAAKFDDGISRSPWPIELHDGERPTLHWILDDYYEVPYGTLVPAEGENIIVAGRCLSAEHEALASARVTAQCFEYGHAAAAATLISLESGLRYRDIDGRNVRAAMIRNGSALTDQPTSLNDSSPASTERVSR